MFPTSKHRGMIRTPFMPVSTITRTATSSLTCSRAPTGARAGSTLAATSPSGGPPTRSPSTTRRRNLLFVGTEFGVFATRDGGQHWHPLKSGMPPIAVRDLEIQRRESDLVVGTFGRGIYILDDYSPIRHLTPETQAKPAAILPIKKALLYVPAAPLAGGEKAFQGASFYTAPNPPFGATFTYT